jgi:hypothetical protein
MTAGATVKETLALKKTLGDFYITSGVISLKTVSLKLY